MVNKAAFISTIAEKAGQLLGGEKSQTREDIEQHIRRLVTKALANLDLVTREEFDAQAAVLQSTREKLLLLESKVAKFSSTDNPDHHEK